MESLRGQTDRQETQGGETLEERDGWIVVFYFYFCPFVLSSRRLAGLLLHLHTLGVRTTR